MDHYKRKTLAELEKMTAQRLLKYYQMKRNSLYGFQDMDFSIENGEEYEAERDAEYDYVEKIKLVLETKGHVVRKNDTNKKN